MSRDRVIIPLALSPRDRRLREIEEIRAGLPVNQYLMVLHSAAVTGKIPEFEYPDGDIRRAPQPTGRMKDIHPDLQVKVASYLVDKAMPDRPAPDTPDVPTIGEAPPNPKNMTRQQLLDMLLAAHTLAAPKPAPAPSLAPAPEPVHADPSDPAAPEQAPCSAELVVPAS
jgi:hypothetical protein